ncbi:MAG: hypothetical protein HEQ33_02020 [Dolichospermum sp. WA123]|jgi:hypothetical protein|nr:hypothetical protein [Dolichospermum sp. WA123]
MKISDSDKKILKIATSNKQSHPENPQILDILILTITISVSHQQLTNYHPVNPQILDILIKIIKIVDYTFSIGVFIAMNSVL